MIGIRTDANNIIATGHMMRCMTIAREIVMQGESVTFFMADEESKKLFDSFTQEDRMSDNKFYPVVMGTDYRDMEGELPVIKKELQEKNIRVLLVDSYMVTRGYFEELSTFCKTVYLDDLAKEAYPVDVLINYSGYALNMGYTELYKGIKGFGGKNTKLYMGLMYAPLRQQFYPQLEKDKKESGHVLLATGGADMCGMILPTLKEASSNESLKDITWHVVVGDFVENPDEIESYANSQSNIVLHRSVKNMAQLMRKCSFAVLAAGTMLTECAACGLPCVFYQVADNQKYNVQYFGSLEGMIFAGSVAAGALEKSKTIAEIIKKTESVLSDNEKLIHMSESLSEITDGRGAARIAAALMEETQ